MSNRILVTYATRYGSTQEVANTIAAVLRDASLTVDSRPIGEVQTLEGFDAIVLGTPLYMYRLHSDTHRFLLRYRSALVHKPVAIFVLGPVSAEEKDWQSSHEQLDKELAKYPWLRPVALEVFGGKLAPEKVGFPYKLFMGQVQPSDHRNWDVIRAWASALPAQFGYPAGHTELTK